MKWLEHFKLVCHHRRLVRQGCFKLGLYRQGLMHDLSKFSPTEFRVGAKYFQGYRSPNDAERAETGISRSWLHHKGRNRLHFDFWVDYIIGPDGKVSMGGCKMPVEYVAEMFCDRIAACKLYHKEKYTDAAPYLYYLKSKGNAMIHPETAALLGDMLLKLKEEGEDAAFTYVRREILKKK